MYATGTGKAVWFEQIVYSPLFLENGITVRGAVSSHLYTFKMMEPVNKAPLTPVDLI